jgi:hypothetical protein
VIEAGVARKSPAWRFGCWLAGASLLVAFPFWDGVRTLAYPFCGFIAGVLFTATYGISRIRGGGPYVPDPMPIRVKDVGPLTYVLFLAFYRLPVAMGDHVYTTLWNGVTRVRRPKDESVTLTVDPEELATRASVEFDGLWWGRDQH